MARPKETFLVWQDSEDEQFYNQYSSLTDAVSEEGSDAEIFEATLKSLGKFKLVTKVIRAGKTKRNEANV